MDKKQIGFLHPGSMGISIAVIAQKSGHDVFWVSAERSSETKERAKKYTLIETKSLDELCEKCSLIISVCPPHAAMEVAESVVACSFMGIYTDVNAISPNNAQSIGQFMTENGIDFVDGGIIGGPAWNPGTTYLYLSGPSAAAVADCFAAGPLSVEVIGAEIGKASALKMCFAANTKGTVALLCAVVAAAEKFGVWKELEKQWSRNESDYANTTFEAIRSVTAKAWRFSGEMDEIASTLEAAGLPDGFHRAAGDIYRRMSKFKGAQQKPQLDEVLRTLLTPNSGT